MTISTSTVLIGLVMLSEVGAASNQDDGPRAAPLLTEDCPRDGEDVVVCGKRGDRSQFRLPPAPDRFDPSGPVDSVSRERHRLFEVGAVGIGSCSTVGPGGWTGCDLIKWKDGYEQRGGSKSEESGFFVNVGPMKKRVIGE